MQGKRIELSILQEIIAPERLFDFRLNFK